MSSEENENYDAKKKVDININLKGQQQGKKEDVPTVSDAESLAKQLTSLGFPVEPAKDTTEYKQQKRKLQEFLAEEIGRERERRSFKEGHERTSFRTKATGQARLSGEQVTGEDFSGVTGDLKRMEFDDYESMITTLKELSSQGDAEASKYLQQLYKKAIKGSARQHVSAEYHGKITKLLREPRRQGDTEKEAEIEEEIEKEKSKWKEEED